MRNLLALLLLSITLCACNPSATKPAASVTGNQTEATKEDERQAVHGLAPR